MIDEMKDDDIFLKFNIFIVFHFITPNFFSFGSKKRFENVNFYHNKLKFKYIFNSEARFERVCNLYISIVLNCLGLLFHFFVLFFCFKYCKL